MSKELIDAAASYYGLDPEGLHQATMAAGVDGLRFSFVVLVKDADDYLGIADRMRAMREPVEEPDTLQQMVEDRLNQAAERGRQEEEAHMLSGTGFIPMPTLQEVMRTPVEFMDRPECRSLVDKAYSLSAGARAAIDQELERRAENRARTETQGAGGRTVVHVDVPAEEDSKLPDAVWVPGEQLTIQQQAVASDVRKGETGQGDYLMQVAMLTPEQLAQVKP